MTHDSLREKIRELKGASLASINKFPIRVDSRVLVESYEKNKLFLFNKNLK